MRKVEVKAGRAASKMGVVGGVIMIVFGILWINLASNLTQPGEESDPGVNFLMVIGVLFVVAAIAITAFYARSAFAKDRPSILDVEEASGMGISLPVNAADEPTARTETRFCPFCGEPTSKEFLFCKHCGKKLI